MLRMLAAAKPECAVSAPHWRAQGRAAIRTEESAWAWLVRLSLL